MLFLQKLFRQVIILLFLCSAAFAQKTSIVFHKDSTRYYTKQDTIYLNKIIPIEFKDAIQIALQHYPELNETIIKFRIKKTASPLAARPKVLTVFRKSVLRKYIVTISSSSHAKLNPIPLKNLSFNAQVGVIGHELSHVSFYNSKPGIYFIVLALKHLSKRAIDKFEFDTDKRCIEHGLGFQLLSWSNEVRAKLDLKQWGGANNPNSKRERYMNPQTIIFYMNALPNYIFKLK